MHFFRVFKHYWNISKKHRLLFFLMIVFYTIANLLSAIFMPLIFKNIIDLVSLGSNRSIVANDLVSWVFVLGATILFYNIFYRAGDFSLTSFEAKGMRDVSNYAFSKLSKYSYSFFSNTFAGSLVAKAKRFTSSFEGVVDRITFDFFFISLRISGILFVLFNEVPKVALAFLVWIVFYISVVVLFLRVKVKYDLKEAGSDSKVTGTLSDVISNILNLKIFSSRKKEIENFKNVVSEEYKNRLNSWNFANIQMTVQGLMSGILQFSIMFIMVKMWIKGDITAGVLVLVQSYMISLFDSLWGLSRGLIRFTKDVSNAREMLDILEKDIEVKDTENPEQLVSGDGEIEFKNVFFEYIGEKEVFQNFNLKINPGEKVGIVGHSGSGKSTITKILLRFVDIQKGDILIDGQNIKNITQDDLRSKISYVPQDPILFHRSILENISYSKESATKEEIILASQKASADEFISRLPNGYDTMVGERGVKLSGGERQRVAIARAMLKDAPILVLDEATSSLDSISEFYIQKALNDLIKDKTAIVIAHRLSTIQKMDRIIVLDNGLIVEEGSHNELLNKDGLYKNLWDHQTGNIID